MNCDRCGMPLERSVPEFYKIRKDNGDEVTDVYDDNHYIGIAAMYRFDDGAKMDLCKKCTIEIAKEFLKLVEGKIDG